MPCVKKCRQVYVLKRYPLHADDPLFAEITVIWEKLQFFCYLQPLYTIMEVWEDMRRVVEEQRNKVPHLPNPGMINPSFISLSLRYFGESARQIQSVFHIIIDDGTFIHKVITRPVKRRSLDILKRKATNTPNTLSHLWSMNLMCSGTPKCILTHWRKSRHVGS